MPRIDADILRSRSSMLRGSLTSRSKRIHVVCSWASMEPNARRDLARTRKGEDGNELESGCLKSTAVVRSIGPPPASGATKRGQFSELVIKAHLILEEPSPKGLRHCSYCGELWCNAGEKPLRFGSRAFGRLAMPRLRSG